MARKVKNSPATIRPQRFYKGTNKLCEVFGFHNDNILSFSKKTAKRLAWFA